MPDPTLPIDQLAAIDAACDRFESAWQAVGAEGEGPRCEAFAAELAPEVKEAALRELYAIERLYRATRGEELSRWSEDRPQIVSLASESSDEAETLPCVAAPLQSSGALRLRCPQCHGRVDLAVDAALDEVTCGACGSAFGLLGSDQNAALEATRVGRFLLRERIGMGGFGAVWRARDPELDRDVALKLPRRGGLSPHEAELFFREARAAAQLTHPGIVSVHEVGRDTGAEGTGSIYIVSELVDGQPLSDRLKEWRPTRKQAAALVADIADALEYAHSRGVIHRDLKPSNIMLDQYATGGESSQATGDIGRPRLMDFGLAKRDAGEVTMTVDGQVLGTPAYMSPEQASGQIRWVDRRTDLYALGVVLFRLLTGELPFRGTSSSQIQQRLTDDAPSPRRLDDSVPIDLATVCLKCLERDPNRRYDTAADVAAEMRRYLAGEPVRARPLSTWGRAGRWALRRPATATALGLAALLAVAGPTAAVVIGRQAKSLEGRVEELTELQVRQAAEVDRLEREKDAARNSGPRLVPSVTIGTHRRQQIERLLAIEGNRLVAAAQKDPTDSPAGAVARAAVARLLFIVGRTEEAVALLADVGGREPDAPTETWTQLRSVLAATEANRNAAQSGDFRSPRAIAALQATQQAEADWLPEGPLDANDLAELAQLLLEEDAPRKDATVDGSSERAR